MQIKVFNTWLKRRKHVDRLEDQVNEWLQNNRDVEIVEIKHDAVGSFGDFWLVVSILYEPAS